MADALTLHVEAYWLSPWTATVFFALREKGLPFHTSISMMHHGIGIVDAMRERTLTGTAPVLQHGTLWLAESLAIVEYLDDVFPARRVLPDDVRDRARARQVMAWLRTGLLALVVERPIERIFYPPATPPPPLSTAAAANADALRFAAERLGAGPRGALFGDRVGVVDVDLAFALRRLYAELPDPLARYVDAVWAHPSVHEFVAHARPPNPPAG